MHSYCILDSVANQLVRHIVFVGTAQKSPQGLGSFSRFLLSMSSSYGTSKMALLCYLPWPYMKKNILDVRTVVSTNTWLTTILSHCSLPLIGGINILSIFDRIWHAQGNVALRSDVHSPYDFIDLASTDNTCTLEEFAMVLYGPSFQNEMLSQWFDTGKSTVWNICVKLAWIYSIFRLSRWCSRLRNNEYYISWY